MNPEVLKFYDAAQVDNGLAPVGPGTALYYETRGAGSPVTLVNNFFMVAPFWRSFTGRIAENHLVVGYDLRNQGKSVYDGGPVQPKDHIDDIARLLDYLEISRTTVVGASASTLIARDFALAHPDRVDALILAGPIFSASGGMRRRRLVKSWLRSLASGGPAQMFDHVYPLIFSEQTIENGGNAAYLAIREYFLVVATPESAGANLEASLAMSDDPARLRDIQCPTLVVTGDADFLTSPTSLAGIATLIPDCVTEVLPFAGHVPFFEVNESFQETALAFLAGVETGVETDIDTRLPVEASA
jgi:pimeloyl-ACP methyl ester carboxylesterase